MQDTRLEILILLQALETATIQDLTERLKLAAPTVRHHMAVLERDSLVPKACKRGKVGKPQFIYSLDQKGEESFPKRYDRLSSGIIEQVKLKEGQETLRALMRKVAQGKVKKRRGENHPASRPERTALMLQVLHEEGFDPQLELCGDQLEIRHLTCPYRSVALEHSEVCDLDAGLIQGCLGGTVERKASRPNGDRVCVFRVKTSSTSA